MASKERIVLVRSWDELQTGMVCVLKGCSVCFKDHRFMLANAVTNKAVLPATPTGLPAVPTGQLHGFLVHPPTHAPRAGYCSILTDKAMKTYQLYRVVDGLEAERAAARVRDQR